MPLDEKSRKENNSNLTSLFFSQRLDATRGWMEVSGQCWEICRLQFWPQLLKKTKKKQVDFDWGKDCLGLLGHACIASSKIYGAASSTSLMLKLKGAACNLKLPLTPKIHKPKYMYTHYLSPQISNTKYQAPNTQFASFMKEVDWILPPSAFLGSIEFAACTIKLNN